MRLEERPHRTQRHRSVAGYRFAGARSRQEWDYRELRERTHDGFTLRALTDFDSQPVPQHDAFNRAFLRLTPKTVRAINQAVIEAAVELGLEDGKTLRVDTTVVETNIHFPTDHNVVLPRFHFR